MPTARYVLLKELGEGGMGKVYLAEDTHRETKVVLKSLLPQYAENEEIRQRFYREAQILANLSHPGIVKLYDFFIDEGIPYMVMEYLEGQPLDKYLERKGPLSPEETYKILAPVLDALYYMHQAAEVIHRDLKPSNIMVLSDGRGKLLDFGIAKTLDSHYNLTRAGFKVGTVLYMAPEQIRGEALSPRTDLYAMGLVIYECLFGRYPWDYEGKTEFQLYETLLKAPLPVPAWAPAPWKAFIEKALARQPEERFPSAIAMKEALRALSEPTKASVQPEAAPPSAPKMKAAPKSSPESPTSSKAEVRTPSSPNKASPEPSAPEAAPPPAPARQPRKRRRSCLGCFLRLVGILLLIVVALGIIAFGILAYANLQARRREEKIRALLIRELSKYEQKYSIKGQEIDFYPNTLRFTSRRSWEPIRELYTLIERDHEEEGSLSVNYLRKFVDYKTREEETQEPCSEMVYTLFGHYEQTGTRKVWSVYRITQTCQQEGSVDFRYRYLPTQEEVELEGEPEWYPYGEPTCEETDRTLLRRWEGACEVEE